MYYILIIFSIIILFKIVPGIKGVTIKDISKEIIMNDINKVSDMIVYYQNHNITDIENIILCLEEENKKYKSWLDWYWRWKDQNKYFFLPKDMMIKEENNEVVIYYRNLIYNVNKGKFINE